MSDLSPALHSAAGRYASALFELADEADCLEPAAADLRALQGMLAEIPDLARVVRSPLFGRRDQARAMVAMARKVGFSDVVTSFLGVMASNRRLFVLEDSIRAFMALLDARRGIARVRVRSARPLAAEQQEAMRKALAGVVAGDVELECVEEPGLIGGIAVQIGSRLVDVSIRSRLERMRVAMQGGRLT